eukprot:CAMPEP_0194175904 /NCGR_PEP_ID=MMETSP0154-20130528/9913_1 /TAXON_ID=1049557 /ORGANISM="Thalassiothrix antarctica, Strain L6-D1" /LENGTH=200 /DNA_ID=CAMNT_0038889911 /DNA_START=52 /DNA_END=650 /DNA_ORIENTATION=+
MTITTIDEEDIVQNILQDRPTIETAFKTYLSWVVARSLTSEESEVSYVPMYKNTEALAYVRRLLKTINQHKCEKNNSNFRSIICNVWNKVVESNQKPSKCLGRLALLQAWKGIVSSLENSEIGVTNNEKIFYEEFGLLMIEFKLNNTADVDDDSNPNLIWDSPGAELERRRKRRVDRAEKIKKRKDAPRIEDLTEENDLP